VITAGQQLRQAREQLGLTLRDVEVASDRIAAHHRNNNFAISPGRLSDIETKGGLPSIYRLHTLAVLYRRDMREILSWYGIEVNESAADLGLMAPPRSHRAETLDSATMVKVPVRLDPSFDPRRTLNLGRVVEKWGVVPLAYLNQFANTDYTYAYLGSEDFTMYPLLLPGSFLQVDESRNEVMEGAWRSEYERPIYFVETREGFTCCWCSLEGDQITLQPHPLSPVRVRVARHPRDAEVLGQVVGVAMRLGEWRSNGLERASKAPSALS
jgi:transcriptional regulator with XRE-family HTH domain